MGYIRNPTEHELESSEQWEFFYSFCFSFLPKFLPWLFSVIDCGLSVSRKSISSFPLLVVVGVFCRSNRNQSGATTNITLHFINLTPSYDSLFLTFWSNMSLNIWSVYIFVNVIIKYSSSTLQKYICIFDVVFMSTTASHDNQSRATKWHIASKTAVPGPGTLIS